MTMIAFQLITKALADDLSAAAIADKVFKGKLRPIAQSEATALVVRYDRSSGQLGGIQAGPMDWDSAYAIDCYARVSNTEDAQEAAGALVGLVFSRISVISPAGLGITNILANPEVVASDSDVDDTLTCLTLFLTIQHRTGSDNLLPWN